MRKSTGFTFLIDTHPVGTYDSIIFKELLMRAILVSVLGLALLAGLLVAQNRPAKTLDIYVIDVEGGNSQLYVSPSGESVLIDTGNAGAAAVRDADRIMAAIRDAGLKQIDHLIATHYHGDHVGGLLEVAKRIPIQEFIDHGPNVQPAPAIDPILQQYAVLNAKVKHRVVKPGDKVDVTGLDWRIVAAGGRVSRARSRARAQPIPTV